MAANKGKAQGGKKKKAGKNGKALQANLQANIDKAKELDLERAELNSVSKILEQLRVVFTNLNALVARKVKNQEVLAQVVSLNAVSLEVSLKSADSDRRSGEHMESLSSIYAELCKHDNPIWTPTGQKTLVATLSDKFTKWAYSQGILLQYTRALAEENGNPFEDAPQIVDSATHDYGEIAQSILDYSSVKKDSDGTNGEKETTGPSLDSMIEALSASGVEVSATEAFTQQSSQSSSTQPQPKDPKQVAQAFLMFKPYMSQMIEARRKAEKQLHVLEAKVEKLSRKVEEFERGQEPQLLSNDADAVYQPDPRLTLENNTKEFMREHFKAFMSQYKLREEYFEKLLKARSSETAVQIMKVKKYRELSRAGWRMASEALDSLSKVDDRIQKMESKFDTFKALSGATTESLIQECESAKRDYKHLELEHEQSKNKTELMNVMMSDVVAYNAELKETLGGFKELAEEWRGWADDCKPLLKTTLPDSELEAVDDILVKTEELVPREADDPQPPTDAEIEDMLRKGRMEGKTVEQVSQEVIAATEHALKLARERREKRANNSSAMAARVNKHVDNVLTGQIKSDDAITEETMKQVVEAAKILDKAKSVDDAPKTIEDAPKTIEGAPKTIEHAVEKPASPVLKSEPPAPEVKEEPKPAPTAKKEEPKPAPTAKKESPKPAPAAKKESPKPSPKPSLKPEAADGYEADVENAEADKEAEAIKSKGIVPGTKLPSPAANSGLSSTPGLAPDSHLTVYSPVHSDEENLSREAAHDEADGEDDDDFGFKRYVAHEGDVSSEEDEYFLRAKFGICYHDRYTRRGKASKTDTNSYMGVFGGAADKSHNLCSHDMNSDFGQARFADRRGHLFSEVLLHDYVQSDDDTSMQNWTDEVEWEEGVTPDEDEEDEDEGESGSDFDEEPDAKQTDEDRAQAIQNAKDVASGVKSPPAPGTVHARQVAAFLEDMLFAKRPESFNTVQIPDAFSEEEWKVHTSGSVVSIVPLLMSYMVAAFTPNGKLTLDERFPRFMYNSCNWFGAIGTLNFLSCYYSSNLGGGYKDKYGWDPIGLTIRSLGDIDGVLDESRSLCPMTLDLIPFLLFAARALAEVSVYPTWSSGDAADEALRNAIMEHNSFLSVEDLYRLVLEHRPPKWGSSNEVYTTLLDALLCAFVSLYMRVSRFPFELDKLATLPVMPPVEGATPSKNVYDILTKIEDEKAKFQDATITKLEQVLLHQASAALRRCTTKNVYPEDTYDDVEMSVQEKVLAFLSGNGKDETYNKVVAHNRPMLLRALENNQLDVERVAQLHDAYEKLDGEIASVAQTANGNGEGSANGSATGIENGTSGGNN